MHSHTLRQAAIRRPATLKAGRLCSLQVCSLKDNAVSGLGVWGSGFKSEYLSTASYVATYRSIALSIGLSICQSIYLSVCNLPTYRSISIPVYPSIFLSIDRPIDQSIYSSGQLALYLYYLILSRLVY